MSVIVKAAAKALPEFWRETADIIPFLDGWLKDQDERFVRKVKKIFEGAAVDKRYSFMSPEEVFSDLSFEARNDIYIREGIKLGAKCLENALEKANWKPQDLDYIITVSCTGIMIPSLDAYLINLLKLRQDIVRLPVTEMGCAAGVSGMIYAKNFLKANPGKRAAVVAVESPSATFQLNDFSMANIVSAAIFGDGAACVLLSSDPKDTGPEIIAEEMYHFYDAEEMMGFKLTNGDQIEVTTNKNQKPSEHWLKLTVTGKARSKIRSAMKEEKRKKGEIAKEALMRKMKNQKIQFEDNIDFLVKEYGYQSRPDLYYALSTEAIKMPDFKIYDLENGKLSRKVIPKEVSKGIQAPSDTPVKKNKTLFTKSNILVHGESADQYEYSLAQCCKPVQGDDIFGYLTTGQGLKIHRINCKNATHLLANYSYRVLKAEWANKSGSNFMAELSIIGVDSGPGVIQALTNEISNNLGINIRSFSIQGDEGYFEGKISLFVKNKDQLNHVIAAIKRLDGINNVTRIDKESNE